MNKAFLACALALGLAINGPVAAQNTTTTRIPAPARTPALAPVPANQAPIAVGVFAHPDDELVVAPALAALVREGYDVRLIYATDGDQGPGVSGLMPGAELGSTRYMEAACASIALGIYNLVPLGLGDGTLGIDAREPGSPVNRLREGLRPYLADAKTVITWGPDGGYGHADHRMVSAVVTQLVQVMPAETRPQLLYPALINIPLPEPLASQGWATTAPDLATVRYRYNDADLAAANKAAQCHKTQFDEATRAMIVPGFDAAVWKGEVAFRPAF